jgi:DNA modification methylase
MQSEIDKANPPPRRETIGHCTIHLDDCRRAVRSMPSQSVHCCVTSPPYFGLRDYGHDEQIGMEQTPDAFVAEVVSVFREVRRVLRDDGTLWLNLGDSYVATATSSAGSSSSLQGGKATQMDATRRPDKSSFGLPMKNLIGIPWRVAFALQADGWYLRQDIIWHKPNPMPESVRDRCTKAHEYIFLLAKSEKYYFDTTAMQEPATGRPPGNKTHKYVAAYETADNEMLRTKAGLCEIGARETRNKRSVWTVTTKPFKGAHFAAFPPDLIEPCILAGCPEGGTVLDPFFGAGTTGMVSATHKRRTIGIELNQQYFDMACARLRGEKLDAALPMIDDLQIEPAQPSLLDLLA